MLTSLPVLAHVASCRGPRAPGANRPKGTRTAGAWRAWHLGACSLRPTRRRPGVERGALGESDGRDQAPGQRLPQYGQVNSPSSRLNAWRQKSQPIAGKGRKRWGERIVIPSPRRLVDRVDDCPPVAVRKVVGGRP